MRQLGALLVIALLLPACSWLRQDEERQPAATESAKPAWTRPKPDSGKPAAKAPVAPPKPRPPPPPVITPVAPGQYQQSLAAHKQALLQGSEDPLSSSEVGYYMDILEASLVQRLRDSAVNMQRSGDSIKLLIPGRVSFDSDSATPVAALEPLLANMAGIFSEYRRTRLAIEGHTDDVGEADFNQRLSEQRALAVAEQLIAAGVNKRRILIVGFGESMPLAPNSTEAGRARNRRIDIRVEPLVKSE